MTNKQKIKCLFNHHKYTIPHKKYLHILLCKHCMRFGCRKTSTGYTSWYEFNEEGKSIYYKGSDGHEVWFDKKENVIHCKHTTRYEIWFDEKGNVIKTK